MATNEASAICAQESQENTFSGILQKISEAMDEVAIFYKFPIPWVLRVSEMGCYAQK